MSVIQKLLKKLKKTSKKSFWTGWQNLPTSPEQPLPQDISAPSTYVTQMRWSMGDSSSAATPDLYTQTVPPSNQPSSGEPAKDEREVKKPVELVEDVLMEEPKMNLADLDKQIKVIEKRMEVIKGLHKKGISMLDEERSLFYLKCRKKYEKNKHLFAWKITTQEMIDKLCKKYKVQLVGFASYYKNVPAEAVDQLEKFSKAYNNVVPKGVEPTLKLIIDYGGKETKKDPILLASSPFGNWWYVLGAWDKEVEIVDDLIYHGK